MPWPQSGAISASIDGREIQHRAIQDKEKAGTRMSRRLSRDDRCG
jgi:hypothetical protein